MAAQTGRTVSKWCKFQIDDSAGTLRDVGIESINGIGLSFDETDLTVFQDAIKSALQGQPDFSMTLGMVFDNSAAQTASSSGQAAALSGSHTVMKGLLAAVTAGTDSPLAFGFYVGNRHYWETGEDVFGITGTATNGVRLFDYTFDPATQKSSAKFRMSPGSAAPGWGTTAYT